MSLQANRLETLCEQLALSGVLSSYDSLAQIAAKAQSTYVEYLENVLTEEVQLRKSRGK